MIANNSYKDKDRDLTQYLNNWKPIKSTLGVKWFDTIERDGIDLNLWVLEFLIDKIVMI